MSKIYINPGHGGTDSGAVGVGGRQEKNDALRYASAVAEKLRAAGHDVKLERDGDYLINVKDIAERANAWGADYFIAFHRNSGGGTGAECLIVSSASAKSREMAQAIQNALVAVGFKNRGVKVQDKNTYVLSHTTMPATTIECGFIDNAGDNALFGSKQGEIVQGITDAILSIAGRAAQNPTTPPAQPTYTKKSFTLDHVVKKGSKEAVVGSIQNNLKAIGYDIGTAGPNGDGIDNNFGTKTDAAVRDVQKNGGVTVDGQVGKNTTPLLGGTWAEKSAPAPAPAPSIPALNRILEYGCKGDDVRMMQERLNAHKANVGKADGEFGDKTRRGLHAFQQARINEGRDVGCGYNGNEPDDKCGELTWAILWEPAPGE